MCQSANTMQDEVTTTRLHASKLAHLYILSLFVFLDEGSSFRCVDSFFIRLVESCFY